LLGVFGYKQKTFRLQAKEFFAYKQKTFRLQAKDLLLTSKNLKNVNV
jgi:hypothetical protein